MVEWSCPKGQGRFRSKGVIMKPVKYLLKGWKVNDQGEFERHCEIVDTYALAEVALQCMELRNLDSMKLKIDSIEAI